MRPGIFAAESVSQFSSSTRAGLPGRLALLFSAVLLLSLAFPNELVRSGMGPLAWLALAPLIPLFLHEKARFLPLWGAAFGLAISAIATFWLGTYHTVALLVVATVNAFVFGILFTVEGFVARRLPGLFFILGPVVWVASEYLRTQGFLGNPYLIMVYSQYESPSALGLSALGGIWLPGLVLLLPSWQIGQCLVPRKGKFLPGFNPEPLRRSTSLASLGITVLLLLLGISQQKDYRSSDSFHVALVQHSRDPWEGGIAAYVKNLAVLERLSRKAILEKPSMVVWSETAFVPPIEYHLRYREVPETERLVRDLLEFLPSLGVPVLFGQNHAERRIGPGGEKLRDNYNAVLLYDQGFKGRYDKMHLVPFTEYFPYGDVLPWMKQWLVDNKANFWIPGTNRTIFSAAGFRFASPVCFEDSFGYISRNFVNDGAQVLITLSNDTWSGSVTAMMQHLSMAVFRSAETGRSQARASNGGMTAAIDPNGRIVSMLPPFTEDVLQAKLPLIREGQTLYLLWGDWFAWVLVILASAGLFMAVLAPRMPGRSAGSHRTVDSKTKKEQYSKQREQP